MDKKEDSQPKNKEKDDKAEKYEKPALAKYSKVKGMHSVSGASIA